MWTPIETRLDRLHTAATDKGRHGAALALRVVIFSIRAVGRLVGEDALRTAAALSFTSILAMVPLLAVTFGLLRAFVSDAVMAGRVRDWLLGSLLADSVGQVTTVIESFLLRAQGGAVGVVGFSFLLVTSLSLFLSIERAFNRIWHVPASRPMHRRLTTFYAIITLTPALMGLGFVAASWMQSGLDAMPFGFVVGAWFIELVLSSMALLLLYRLLPHASVEWRMALLGAVWAAVMFQLSKWGFNTYVRSIYTGSVSAQIYGSFALIPVFFLWVYLVWIIVLGGVELAYMVQNRESLTSAVLTRRGRSGGHAPPTGYLIARTFFEVARHFRQAGGGITPETVAGRLQIDLQEVHAAVRLLRAGDLLLAVEGREESELVPARPLDHIKLAELYALGAADGYRPGQLPAAGAEALEVHLMHVSDRARGRLDRTIAEFVDLSKEDTTPPDDLTVEAGV